MTSNRFGGMGAHHSARAGTEEWLTPPALLDALGGAGSFDLDPAAPIVRPWPTAREHLTIEDNGLLRAWWGRVWLNPPYGSALIRWMARMAEHGRGVALIFARTETEAFSRFVWDRASAALFIEGRINFHLPDGTRCRHNAGAPSVLCSYGATDADILSTCNVAGKFVPLLIPSIIAVRWLGLPGLETWRGAILRTLRGRREPIRLDELYRIFADHPKARGRKHWREKLRQVLQQGPFERVGRGEWRMMGEGNG